MMLTPLPSDELQAHLARFAGHLDGAAGAVLSRLARPEDAARAAPPRAERHRREALALARGFGMGTIPGRPSDGFSWDGAALREETEAYVLIHEVAHFQLAPPSRRRVVDFGLGAGPETGRRAEADTAASIFGLARDREEGMASLLGILWEVELGQPGLASFLDQNWLEGAERPSAGAHFAATLARLRDEGFLDAAYRPRRGYARD
jgi:hypothetical protein